MLYNYKKVLILIIIIFQSVIINLLNAQPRNAPPNIVAAFLLKLTAFEKNIIASPIDITVYVLGAPEVARELKVGIGQKIGKAKLKNVIYGNILPESNPSIIYLGKASMLKETIEYTRSHNILSVTGIKELIKKGISLGIGIGDDGKPQIFLNLAASAKENLDWNPAILKVAKIVK